MKIVSMTGYGCSEKENDLLAVCVEIKTVNSRFLDFNLRLPREYSQFEIEIRKQINAMLKRGRVDLIITRRTNIQSTAELEFNKPLFDAYLKLYTECDGEEGVKKQFIKELLLKKEIADSSQSTTEVDEAEKNLLFDGIREALTKLYEARVKEGAELEKYLLNEINNLDSCRTTIATKAAAAPARYKDKLNERLSKLVSDADFDKTRLEQEVAIFADRVDITEELVRLESHLKLFLKEMENTPNGRSLEFVLQECGREFNTIASKAQDAEIQTIVVSAKAALERIREQVQNVE